MSLNIQLSIHAFNASGISLADPGFCSKRVKNPLLSKNFDENCLKMNEIGPRGGRRVPSAPLDPPMHFGYLATINKHPSIASGGSRIFPRGVPTPKVGVLTYYFAIFGRKLHENERI